MIRTIGFIQHPTTQHVLACIYALVVAFVSIFTQNIQSLAVSFGLVLFFMVGDFFTGIFASVRVRKQGIESSKLRWSIAKYAVYIFFIIGTLIIGILLHMLSCFNDGLEMNTKTSILTYTLTFLTCQMIFVSWIEAVSVVENLRLVYPKNTFLKGLHYVLLVDFKGLIPQFSNFLKEEKSKDMDKLNNENN